MATKARAVEVGVTQFSSDTSSESESSSASAGEHAASAYERRQHEHSKAALIDISRQFQESLKYDKQEGVEADTTTASNHQDTNTSSTSGCTSIPHHACVHFHTTVCGVEISSHRDVPERDRRRLWNSFAEIQTNAERNVTEFRADGWEWRNATEETDMLLQGGGGNNNHSYNSDGGGRPELVHPASFKRLKPAQKRKLRKKEMRRRRRRARQY